MPLQLIARVNQNNLINPFLMEESFSKKPALDFMGNNHKNELCSLLYYDQIYC